MEKEISSGAMLGIVLIALAAVVGLGFGVFVVAVGVTGNAVLLSESTLISSASLLFSSICSFGIGVFIKHRNEKLEMWGNLGNEHFTLLRLCDMDKYVESTQIATPKKVSLFKAARCKLTDVVDLQNVVFDRSHIVNVKGTVKIKGNFYLIDGFKLARGPVVFDEGQSVDIVIKTHLNVESSLGIFRIYDVVK